MFFLSQRRQQQDVDAEQTHFGHGVPGPAGG
jgi:hypothetical protein